MNEQFIKVFFKAVPWVIGGLIIAGMGCWFKIALPVFIGIGIASLAFPIIGMRMGFKQ